jgi:rRNA biogenesis protein RRP5
LNGFREGDAVRAKIVKIDMEKGKINFGIKPKYFDDNEEEDDDDDEDEEESDKEENGLELKSDDEDEEALDGEMDEDDEGEDEDEDEEDDEDVDVSNPSRLGTRSLTFRSTCLANQPHPSPSPNLPPNPPHPL